jgi:hypothetical protein
MGFRIPGLGMGGESREQKKVEEEDAMGSVES